jgi:hypothetical protein
MSGCGITWTAPASWISEHCGAPCIGGSITQQPTQGKHRRAATASAPSSTSCLPPPWGSPPDRSFTEEAHSIALHPTGSLLLVGFSDKLRLMAVLLDDLKTVKELAIRGCRCVRSPVRVLHRALLSYPQTCKGRPSHRPSGAATCLHPTPHLRLLFQGRRLCARGPPVRGRKRRERGRVQHLHRRMHWQPAWPQQQGAGSEEALVCS